MTKKGGDGSTITNSSAASSLCPRATRRPRILEVLDLAWASRPPAERSLPWFCDYSQCILRKKFSEKPMCQTQTSRIYDYSRDQAILPGEALQMQGLPVPDMDISMLGPQELYSIVGQSFFAPSVATMILAVFLNEEAPWWTSGGDSSGKGSTSSH
jgi:hypothetical protein